MENFFLQLSNLSQSAFLLENPTHWGLEVVVCSIFAKPVLGIFAVCSLVPRMNLSHTQQIYLCPKNQNYLLEGEGSMVQGQVLLKGVCVCVCVGGGGRGEGVWHFSCHHNFIKKSQLMLSKNEPKNIP